MPIKQFGLIDRKYFRFWLVVISIIGSLLFFEEIVDDVFRDPLEGDIESQVFDRKVTQWAHSFRSPVVTQAMTDLTALGSVSVIATIFVLLASVVVSFKDLKGLVYLGAVLVGAGVIPAVLKLYFARDRPMAGEHLVNVTDLSFPSGHAFGSAAVYAALAYYAGRYARNWSQEIFFYFLASLLIFIVGVSRIYLGVHYPTDVLAGFSGGIAWALLISAVFEYSFPFLPRKTEVDRQD